jgi:hypothetical protein
MDDDLASLDQDLNISELDADAIQMYELFSSFQKAGFSERQSILLVALIGVPEPDMVIYDLDNQSDNDEEGQEDV